MYVWQVLASERDPDKAWSQVAKLQQEAIDAVLAPTPKQAPKVKLKLPTAPGPGQEAASPAGAGA